MGVHSGASIFCRITCGARCAARRAASRVDFVFYSPFTGRRFLKPRSSTPADAARGKREKGRRGCMQQTLQPYQASSAARSGELCSHPVSFAAELLAPPRRGLGATLQAFLAARSSTYSLRTSKRIGRKTAGCTLQRVNWNPSFFSKCDHVWQRAVRLEELHDCACSCLHKKSLSTGEIMLVASDVARFSSGHRRYLLSTS